MVASSVWRVVSQTKQWRLNGSTTTKAPDHLAPAGEWAEEHPHAAVIDLRDLAWLALRNTHRTSQTATPPSATHETQQRHVRATHAVLRQQLLYARQLQLVMLNPAANAL